MFGRKSKTVSIPFGDLNYGFVLSLESERLASSGIAHHLRASDAIPLGDGSPSGLHIVMGAIAQDAVMIVLGTKPRDIGGVFLEQANPASPYWDKVVRLMREQSSAYTMGIPGLARANADGSVDIYVITG